MPDFLTLIVIAIVIWIITENSAIRRRAKPLESFQDEAMQQFRSFRTRSSTPSLMFNGAEAEILQSKEDVMYQNHRVIGYTITIFAINQHCENFMFVSNLDGEPFFKHVSHTNAKVILGDQYREPT